MKTIAKFTNWWNYLETAQKLGFISVVFLSIGYLILFICFPIDMFWVSLIIVIILSFIGAVYFLFVNPPWDNY